jgi:hypothetical protein
MTMLATTSRSAIMERLGRSYAGHEPAWNLFYRPRWERVNFATRYHLVYPALAYFILLKREPDLASTIRPQLDTIYRGLLDPRTWTYWQSELGETTWPLQERNLTFAGRLATFVGFYIDAFGEPPAERIELGGRATSYTALSESLWQQAVGSPSRGVSCYHHQSMVMCNAHLLINNLLHDRLFGTSYAAANAGWLRTLEEHLLRRDAGGALFFFGTQSSSCAPVEQKFSIGMDIWSLFLMSGVIPERVREWFTEWRGNITHVSGRASVEIAAADTEAEASSTALATAWAFCLAKELGIRDLAESFQATLDEKAATGFELDPLLSGLYLLGDSLEPGAFRRLVVGVSPPCTRPSADRSPAGFARRSGP